MIVLVIQQAEVSAVRMEGVLVADIGFVILQVVPHVQVTEHIQDGSIVHAGAHPRGGLIAGRILLPSNGYSIATVAR